MNQIPTLGSDVAVLKSEVSSLKQEVSSLKEMNVRLRKDLANLNLGMDEAKIDLQELRGQEDENQHAVQNKLREMEERFARLEQKKPIPSTSARQTTTSLPIPPPPPKVAKFRAPVHARYANGGP